MLSLSLASLSENAKQIIKARIEIGPFLAGWFPWSWMRIDLVYICFWPRLCENYLNFFAGGVTRHYKSWELSRVNRKSIDYHL